MDDKHQFIEKPDVVKVTSPVSQTGRGGDSPDLVILTHKMDTLTK
jgi:hypothetical protein